MDFSRQLGCTDANCLRDVRFGQRPVYLMKTPGEPSLKKKSVECGECDRIRLI